MFIEDAIHHGRGDVLIPDAVRVHDDNRPIFTHTQTVSCRAFDAFRVSQLFVYAKLFEKMGMGRLRCVGFDATSIGAGENLAAVLTHNNVETAQL